MRRTSFLAVLFAAVLPAALLHAGRLTDGQLPPRLVMPITAISAGGTSTTGGAYTLLSTIGALDTPMTGGSLSITSGVLASVRIARENADAAHAFPTPYMPNAGLGHTRITFTMLPSEVEIKIFTLSGHLVKTLRKNDISDSLIWSPVSNEEGTPLASGVYLFSVVQPHGTKKKGKIMVIR